MRLAKAEENQGEVMGLGVRLTKVASVHEGRLRRMKRDLAVVSKQQNEELVRQRAEDALVAQSAATLLGSLGKG